MSRQTPDGAVLVDMTSGDCFELNGVGRLMWQEIATATPLVLICASLRARFDVPQEVIEGDVLAIAEDLRRVGLVDVIAASPASARP
jgi:hypothetical protein